jgi:flagellin
MNITSLSGLTAVQQQNLQKSSQKLSAAIAAIVSGNRISSAGQDIASLSIASQLQAGVAGLRQASGNIAQAVSLSQVADAGISSLSDVALRLRDLAQTASSPTLSDGNREALGEEFKQLIQQFDQIASGTRFNGKPLLDGSLSGDNSLSLDALLGESGSDTGSLSLDSLLSADLFGGTSLALTSAGDASNAFAVIGDVLSRLSSARAGVGSFTRALDYAAASIDTAAINQEAARAALSDTDITEATSAQSQANLQQNAAIALAAQGNRLTPALLRLVG